MQRRDFLKAMAAGAVTLALPRASSAQSTPAGKPNVILCMTDDQGWGDTAYNGHPVLQTPNLDAMAQGGIRFDRWYSGAPVCSPTRGSCITGRHPYRYGVFFANSGHMRKQEITLAEALKTQGYTTGHFGKWHLGTLTTEIRDSNRGAPGATEHYAPPWDHGFDVCFSTEAKVPTWDPMWTPGTQDFYGTYYWRGNGAFVDPSDPAATNLDGDDSRVIMDRAIPFIEQAVARSKPFLAVIWFHTPHKPVVAGPAYLAKYKAMGENDTQANYYGCLEAMDEQVGRLRQRLVELGVADNTMLWFSSDNGPENASVPGSAGPFRGRKRSLYEGGVRVPGLLVWPARIPAPRVVDMACSTQDYFPTILDALGFQMRGQPLPIDGVSLLPLIDGTMTQRPRPLGFESRDQLSLTDNRYKIYSSDGGATYELYDLPADPSETTDLAAIHPDIVDDMKAILDAWQASCDNSLAGNDYLFSSKARRAWGSYP